MVTLLNFQNNTLNIGNQEKVGIVQKKSAT